MESRIDGGQAASAMDTERSLDRVRQVINLLDSASRQLYSREHAAQRKILKAAFLLQRQINQTAPIAEADDKGRMLPWQARKVRDYIDSHIASPVRIADLSALVGRSDAHFSRSFKRTFGISPHSFVVGRRVELAARYMLTTEETLSEIALRCGFTDQAHLCKHFRQAAGQTPAAWRRGQRRAEHEALRVERHEATVRNGIGGPHWASP
jgi:AraC-like DNA-binding protein